MYIYQRTIYCELLITIVHSRVLIFYLLCVWGKAHAMMIKLPTIPTMMAMCVLSTIKNNSETYTVQTKSGLYIHTAIRCAWS